MATKNIVPRASGEGGFGREDKPWGSLYADNIPCIDKVVLEHNSNLDHSEGIAGNAPTASKFKDPVKINNVPFDGSQDIRFSILSAQAFSEKEITNMFNSVMGIE